MGMINNVVRKSSNKKIISEAAVEESPGNEGEMSSENWYQKNGDISK